MKRIFNSIKKKKLKPILPFCECQIIYFGSFKMSGGFVRFRQNPVALCRNSFGVNVQEDLVDIFSSAASKLESIFPSGES